MEPTIEALPLEIQSKLENLEKQRKRASELTKTYTDVEEAIELFSDALPGLMCVLQLSDYEAGHVLMQVHNVTSMKAIVPLVRFLRKKGHKVVSPLRDSPENNFREYYLQDIQLRVYLAVANEKACKYVQTGTKTVPVYELRCVGDEVVKPEEVTNDQPPF